VIGVNNGIIKAPIKQYDLDEVILISVKLFIKNMVCPRCVMSVEQLLREHDLRYTSIRLGEVELLEQPQEWQLKNFSAGLQEVGFELLDDQRKQQIEKIKSLLIQKVQGGDMEEHFSISRFLSSEMHRDYSHISKLFTEVEGITIEQYFILQKIEKVKEWLVYNQLSVNEISLNLGYSSVQHLSGQFKKITGMTPSEFKKVGTEYRRSLDNISQ
jgi:AraC-like DNA-binding protein